MDHRPNYFSPRSLRGLACLLWLAASILEPSRALAQAGNHVNKTAPSPLDAALQDTLMDLDGLLVQSDPQPNPAASQIPPLEKLLDEDIRPKETGNTGTITVYQAPAEESAPAATPAPAPVVGANTLEPVAAAPAPPVNSAEPEVATTSAPAQETGGMPVDDPVIVEETTIDLPPALSELPGLPVLQSATGQEVSMMEADPNSGVPSSSISTNVTINLIQKLVERGALTQGDAAELVQVAQAEAMMAQQMTAQGGGTAPDGAVRVTYIPEVVKAQIRDEVREDVFAQARREGWAPPDEIPDWISKFEPFGDLRLRFEYQRFPEGNDNTGAFPNFNAINTGSPFDVSGTTFSPQYNVDQDRSRVRLRVRFGTELDLGHGFTGGIRLATGDGNSPVSPNQTLGGSGGNFSKYQIWLDRGFIKYELGGQPDRNLAIMFGRFDNPFFNTDILWDEDLGFDGVALKGRYAITDSFTPFVSGGIFPIFNTDLNYASNQPSKFESEDKWLYGAQIGFEWKIVEDVTLKLAASYYDFNNVEGRLSTPYIPLSTSDAGDTDATRPSFAQKGNTYRPLRNIIPSPINNFGTSMQYQYFGLASPFRELAYTGRLEINSWEPYQIAIIGEFVQNLDFDQDAMNLVAVNNRGPNDFATGSLGEFDGGNTAWFAGVQFGKAKFEKAGDWSTTIGFRHVESDSVVDAFTESDFGGGGTNLQGYVIGASVALSSSVRLSLRYMSSDEIAGPPIKNDTFQIDINAKF